MLGYSVLYTQLQDWALQRQHYSWSEFAVMASLHSKNTKVVWLLVVFRLDSSLVMGRKLWAQTSPPHPWCSMRNLCRSSGFGPENLDKGYQPSSLRAQESASIALLKRGSLKLCFRCHVSDSGYSGLDITEECNCGLGLHFGAGHALSSAAATNLSPLSGTHVTCHSLKIKICQNVILRRKLT